MAQLDMKNDWAEADVETHIATLSADEVHTYIQRLLDMLHVPNQARNST